uniref:p6-HSP n=1 Tax=Sweet potato chlorotic stunt virus TaxID=81931 RepID=G3EHH5_9CLOS|nr:p6-SHP [Sweet potato chlorotic stunt virus]AEO37508.1 p6-HSP [Sweet potato chlorotic stunt virus]AEO37510.1 p6-SHP [Sweet potato chlorotic stunt virus]AEO37514.1 p6-HSP [Sweet potato chlorotic stunt virus]
MVCHIFKFGFSLYFSFLEYCLDYMLIVCFLLSAYSMFCDYLFSLSINLLNIL